MAKRTGNFGCQKPNVDHQVEKLGGRRLPAAKKVTMDFGTAYYQANRQNFAILQVLQNGI
jgi:hypothetical protein